MAFLKNLLSIAKQLLGFGIGSVHGHDLYAVEITQRLKEMADGLIDVKISNLFRTTLDGKVLAFIMKVTPRILFWVAEFHKVVNRDWKNSDPEEVLQEIVPILNSAEKTKRGEFLADLAAHLAFRYADGKYSFSEVWQDCQKVYMSLFKRKK